MFSGQQKKMYFLWVQNQEKNGLVRDAANNATNITLIMEQGHSPTRPKGGSGKSALLQAKRLLVHILKLPQPHIENKSACICKSAETTAKLQVDRIAQAKSKFF
jgi:hypothetical protein